MAARKRKIRHDENTRDKIQASQIVNRLTKHILGEVDMPASAVSAALGLLKKVMPDLSSAEIKSETTVRYVARMPTKASDSKTWQQQQRPAQTIQ
ncbi:MAG TPA: hypothetical protein VEA41_23345 [Salinarimonas sp.]|nr:hypothetical protein [Salinarimonas sp.]